MAHRVKPFLCSTCGESDSTNFYGDRKTECKSCQNVRVKGYYHNKSYLSSVLRSCVQRTKQKAWDFDLTQEILCEMYEQQGGMCFYYQTPMQLLPGSLDSVSVDRIDCKLGYTQDNVVLCTRHANLGRQDKDIHQYIAFIKENLR